LKAFFGSLFCRCCSLNIDFLGLYSRLAPNLFWGGEQAAWWGPMAIAVIAGLTFATFLTLVLVPVMYSLLDDFDDLVQRYFTRPVEQEDVAQAVGVLRSGPVRPVPSGGYPAGV